jgi:hypothetical protein
MPQCDDHVNDHQTEHFRVVQVVSLSSLTRALSATDAATLKTLAADHAAAIQAFLHGASADAAFVRAALSGAGVDPATVVSLVSDDHDRVVLLTAV